MPSHGSTWNPSDAAPPRVVPATRSSPYVPRTGQWDQPQSGSRGLPLGRGPAAPQNNPTEEAARHRFQEVTRPPRRLGYGSPPRERKRQWVPRLVGESRHGQAGKLRRWKSTSASARRPDRHTDSTTSPSSPVEGPAIPTMSTSAGRSMHSVFHCPCSAQLWMAPSVRRRRPKSVASADSVYSIWRVSGRGYEDPEPYFEEIADLPNEKATRRMQEIYLEPIKTKSRQRERVEPDKGCRRS